ncbi:MAG: hypothetical protein GY694_17210 [Gammaproteobacteria bacterium]|nr:hypothetical protein [Gammaproteobacteria bacterium]
MKKNVISLLIVLGLASNSVNSEVLVSEEEINSSVLVNNITPPNNPKNNNLKEIQEKNNHKKAWPETFIPSEKINADSSVSFPVDI